MSNARPRPLREQPDDERGAGLGGEPVGPGEPAGDESSFEPEEDAEEAGGKPGQA